VIKHIVMWKLKNPADAPHFKAQLDSCRNLTPGMLKFEVATRTAALDANCDVVLYSVFESSAALAAYQNHPQHQRISSGLGVLRDSRSVLDYEISDTYQD
jgi:quinol monooxygenase YgiN